MLAAAVWKRPTSTLPSCVALGCLAMLPMKADAAPPPTSAPVQATVPPRLDGAYVGLSMGSAVALARVRTLDTDGAFAGVYGAVRAGQMVLPWLGLGVQLSGGYAVRSETGARQRLGEGAFMAEGTFVPAPRKLDLSLHAAVGLGAGAVRQAGIAERSGFGGAAFGAAIRYTWFPGVKRYRSDRGGGFGIGPELGWRGATPAAPGRPMLNLFYLALTSTWYFGS